ncbi:hypothetical protein VOLCADRAFT_68093 [Volvox carteri f. nagariensis]|uniref:Beta-amylase n=1 Tax=Volvox carteri f. nagariensis TaxID=3068 RepID=D8UF66_VOLCA|nr:uncharacterized protein VOLCADRAFT_68093 [Volvox carteri f. nagariensis]EFJ41627.1 hypothetical protein VOLCADRAFT_68093 [Volvox carteri f. nagariensis]|eukprot:XP_002957283.1 hypothetical protein VOLCADRAFT_68093 [Volvox carteri f. nagariensis]
MTHTRHCSFQALRSGLKALRALGINGICVDVYWGIVEGVRPREYDWSSYKQLLALIRDEGFMAQVCLCFHGNDMVPLPSWVAEAGRANPDIYYTDKEGVRCPEFVTLGANEVPVLAGRTPLECYRDLMTSFRREMGPLLGSTILDVLIGLGPDGELKYPAQPLRGKQWTFPGVGEFQCYDKYMLSCLRACAQQVNEPSWGLRGPHDAGSYNVWPHQTGFFHQRGNWNSPYGKFFLQWYGDMLLQHADDVLGIARQVLLTTGPPPPSLPGVALPSLSWWYGTASHAPELTAGYFNTATRDGYLPVMHVLSRNGVSVRLRGGELRSREMHPQACCDPERQLTQQRTVAAALRVSVGLENCWERFDEGALGRLEGVLFETGLVQSLVFNRLCDSMFEPGNWTRFKDFVKRVRSRAETRVGPSLGRCGSSSSSSSGGGGSQAGVYLPATAAAAGSWAVSESTVAGSNGNNGNSNGNGGGAEGGGAGGGGSLSGGAGGSTSGALQLA